MRFRGGYNLPFTECPDSIIEELPLPEALHLPLWSKRFFFSKLEVKNGEHVLRGQPLARDPAGCGLPLLAPRGGLVRFGLHSKHITISEIGNGAQETFDFSAGVELPGIQGDRQRLLEGGAWEYFVNVRTGKLPDVLAEPGAVLVNTLQIEPYQASSRVLCRHNPDGFRQGLRLLRSLFQDIPITIALADGDSLIQEIVETEASGNLRLQILHVPEKYPNDNLVLLVRRSGYDTRTQQVWGVDLAGVLAVDQVLRLQQPITERVISLAGSGVKKPTHLKTMTGYPVAELMTNRLRLEKSRCRIIDGGMMTGEVVPEEMIGVAAESKGITVMEEQSERDFLAFMRPGFNRRSYSRTFAGLLRREFMERPDTAIRGERRPCVACGYCEQACPAGIMPQLIHRHLYGDDLEEAERLRIDLCVGCGLCSYVCPSKNDTREEIKAARNKISAAEGE